MSRKSIYLALALIGLFAPYCFLCRTKEEYADTIKQIIHHPGTMNTEAIKKSRKEFALTHTWENSVAKMCEIISAFELKEFDYGRVGQA